MTILFSKTPLMILKIFFKYLTIWCFTYVAAMYTTYAMYTHWVQQREAYSTIFYFLKTQCSYKSGLYSVSILYSLKKKHVYSFLISAVSGFVYLFAVSVRRIVHSEWYAVYQCIWVHIYCCFDFCVLIINKLASEVAVV